ncbi:MAG: 50S ribosomal protein P1 [Archaeoglobales archaeon]|nr:50S ribosomal protein P1 [Archaeoglobales archaeon]
MEYVYAALLLHAAGKEITEEKIKAILEVAGVEVNEARVKALVAALEGINISEAIQKASVPMLASAAAAPAAAPAVEAKKEEKKEEKKKEEEEKKEEEAIEGLGALFG